MPDILATIAAYREARGWSEYQLAESQKQLLLRWDRLTAQQQAVVFALIEH